MSNKVILNQCIVYDKSAASLSDITRPNEAIVLTTPANNCLQILLKNRAEITTQKELFSEVWEKHGIPINANTLYQNIAMIRKAFRQLGVKEDIIVTVPRRGVLVAENVQIVDFISDEYPPPECSLSASVIRQNDERQPDEGNKSGQSVQMQSIGAPPRSNLKKRLIMIAFYFLLMAVTALFSSFLYLQYLNTQSRFYSYHYFDDYQGCQIYVDSRGDNQNRKSIEESLNVAQISCDNKERVYASFFPGAPRESFIFCDGDILKASTQCRSNYQVFSEK
ncbi:winged helix-turn-helix domain-containing protein [Klebsiella aerogenes]|uniref:winged helix-turn-helix domain-containing protein n=1 Tax=Klebsiella aerogenes TaxID=548 RepID=UPI000F7E0967|nr:winged helix-turn-helix domain-containing protein [Klebsiella aerogenes]MEB5740271.1 winged helix-turn-helix domain-containing protein [Klebsiella aerogenes]RSV83230.1 hypothetical protein EGH57_21205 [Klebsiella aerogenes]